MLNKCNILIFIVLFILHGFLQAQNTCFFKHITEPPELTYQVISDIHYCSKGFMWFAIANKLYRYDGYDFKEFELHDNTQNTVNEFIINDMYSDSRGNLWIATMNMLKRFDYLHERFINYPLATKRKNSDRSKQILYITEDGDSSLLVGTNNGFFIFDYKKHHAKLFKHNQDNPNWLNRIIFIMPEGTAKYWIGMPVDFGLFDTTNNTFVSYLKKIDNKKTAENGTFECFYSDTQNRIWIGTIDSGVYMYDTKSGAVSHLYHQPDNKNSLSCNTVWSIIQENKNKFWIGTELKGLNRYDINSNEFINFKPKSNSITGLSNKSITTLCLDSSQNLWVGTWSGINRCYLKQEQFGFIWLDGKEKITRDVKAICLDKAHYYWIATDEGLFKLNRNKKVVKHYHYDKTTKNGLINYNVSALAQDANGFLWIGTFMGLQRFDIDNEKFTSFRNTPNDTTKLLNDFITSIFIDSKNTIWVGTNAGLHKYNAEKQNFTRFLASDPSINGKPVIKGWNVLCICEDNQNMLWISTEAGLNIYNLKTSCFEPVPAKIQTATDSLAIYDIAIDSENNFWFATAEGLVQYNRKKQQMKRYTTDNGLISNRIHSLLCDKSDNIWIGTTIGLCRLHKATGNFRCFIKADGLENTYFNQAACYNDGNELLFGTKTGIVSFSPQKVTLNPFKPPVYIHGFRIFNKPVAIGDTVMGHVPLKRSIMFTDTLYLSYKHSVISFDFVALNYQKSLKNVYAYKLKGFDNEWITTDAKRRTATYTNLPPGKYCFRVKAANNDLVWNNSGDKIYIIIAPPPWKTWWAYTLYIAIFLAVLLLTMRILIIRENLKNSITIERIEAQKTKEIEQTKTRFFTNVSHEFRTPLTLIISPLENLMDIDERDQQKTNYYQIIHKNANRLLKLVNQILDFSKLESGHLKLRVAKNDMVTFVSETFNGFAFLMQKKNLEAHFYCNLKQADVYFDADKLEKILYNLISNAVKYSTKNASIRLNLILQHHDHTSNIETAQFQIINSGSGIPPEQIDRIFDRYYQIENKKHTSNGTGLGLAITYSLVKLHKGEISVKSDSEHYTRFDIVIPVAKDNYTETEIDAQQTIPETDKLADKHSEIKNMVNKESENSQKTGKQHKTKRLLIVEDNTELRRYLVQQLQTTFDVYEAGNGKQGLRKATNEQPDVIITDIMMPEMDGYELCKILKQQKATSHIPVIMLTSKSSVKNQISGLETGADDYIVKPFNIKIVKLKLKNIIQARNALKANFSKKMEITPSEIALNPMDEQIIAKAMQIVEQNISNTRFNVKDFAKEMAMSKTLLYNKLKALTGMSATEFIRTMRLKRAAQLLASRQLTVTEVSNMVGFSSRNYFTSCFSDFYNCSPSEYKANNSGNQ